jgi:protein involved in polysaccharide export with SLBB domain
MAEGCLPAATHKCLDLPIARAYTSIQIWLDQTKGCDLIRFGISAICIFLAVLLAGSAFPKTLDELSESDVTTVEPLLTQSVSPGTIVLDQIVDPEEYVTGPGDQLTIVFTGKLVKRYTLDVTPEGVLLVPEFGPITIAHIPLAAAKSKILSALQSRYRDVSISVFLTRLRFVKVTVSGEVENPGVIILSAGDRISEAIRSAGGILPGASTRNITLIRGDRRSVADLLKYFRTGSKTANPYVNEGDIIVVPSSEIRIDRIGIFGAVKSPGSFEYSPDDRLSDLLMLAYGLTTDVDSFSCKIVRFEDDNASKRTIEVDLPAGSAWIDSVKTIELFPDDRVYFLKIPSFHETAQVTVIGEVLYPGSYPIVEDSTRITDVIRVAGGLTENASLSEASMDRAGFESLPESEIEKQLQISADELGDVEKEYLKFRTTDHPGRVSIDFWKLLIENDRSYDVTLKDGDRILIPKLSRTVSVVGKVLRPGLIEFSYGKDAEYYIGLAGGFGWKANKGKVKIIKAASGAIVKPSKKLPIEVGDAVVVPEKIPINWWSVIKDVGAFLADIATVYIVIDQVIK